MKIRYLLLFSALLFLFTAGNALSQKRTGAFDMQYDFNGTALYFSCYVPVDYDSTKAYPLIFAWHGSGDNSQNMVNFTVATLAQNIGAIVTCPNLPQSITNDQLNSLLQTSFNWIRQNYSVDTLKEVLYGFSMGGGLVYQIGLSYPDVFDGIIGLAPAIGELSPQLWANIKKIRMATILGTLDFNYAAVSALMNSIKTQGGKLLYKEKPGVQHVDNTYFNSQEFKDDLLECYNFVLNNATSVDDGFAKNAMLVYPNPAKDIITITGLSGHADIVNSIGEKVWSGIIEENGKINVGELNSGIYILMSKFGSVVLLKL